MRLIIEKSVTVITPSVGSNKLKDAVESVLNQTHKTVKHLIVSDGPEHVQHIHNIIPTSSRVTVTSTPQNTGASGFYGHRIYASYPHLIDSDYVLFLDEDNWYDPDHVASLVSVLEEGNDFAYSLRKIYDADKNYIADDNCESLGKWPIWFSAKEPITQHLIDTSSYAFDRNFLKNVAHIWHFGWGGDRHFYNAVRERAKHDTNGKHTLCYRLDGNPNSVKADFFIQGNEESLKHNGGKLPWIKE